MLKRNRLRNYTIGLALATCLVGIFGSLIAITALKSEAVIHQETSHYAAHYENAADIAIQSECFDLALAAKTACTIEKRQAQREAQREEYDLDAQRTMAAWTKAMGFAAIVGMIVGIFGLGLVYTTFIITRRQVAIAEEGLRIQTRPFIYLENIEWEEVPLGERGTVLLVVFLIRNSGLLPAANLRVSTSLAFFNLNDRTEECPIEFTGEVVEISSCPAGVTRRVHDSITLSPEDMARFNDLEIGICFAVRIAFDSRFVSNREIEEVRWANAFALREQKRLNMVRPFFERPKDDLFTQDESEKEANHDASPKQG